MWEGLLTLAGEITMSRRFARQELRKDLECPGIDYFLFDISRIDRQRSFSVEHQKGTIPDCFISSTQDQRLADL
jgi:ATP-dependent RNA circularization protein (DNA/RNA ligase family)